MFQPDAHAAGAGRCRPRPRPRPGSGGRDGGGGGLERLFKRLGGGWRVGVGVW